MQIDEKKPKCVSIRSPQATSIARATAFNQTTVNEFFDNCSAVLEKEKFEGFAVWNVDEIGPTTVHNLKKVLALKGAKQVSQLTSAKRGELVTTCCAVSATVVAIPPFMFFPRVHPKDRRVSGAPTGTKAAAYVSG